MRRSPIIRRASRTPGVYLVHGGAGLQKSQGAAEKLARETAGLREGGGEEGGGAEAKERARKKSGRI